MAINACCCSCILYTDEFGSSLGADWEQVAGSWSNASGLLTTANASAMIVHTTEAPGTSGRVILTTATPDPATARWRLIGAYKDANNYLYVEFYSPSGFGAPSTLTLGYFAGGVETVLSTETNLTQAGPAFGNEYRLCWNGTRAVGGLNTAVISGLFTPVTDGNRAGIATGSSGTDWEFDSFQFTHHKEGQQNCLTCRTCWDSCDSFPDEIEVYIPAATFSNKAFAGTGLDDWFCDGGCTALNDQTYVLTLNDEDATYSCPTWKYEEEGFCDIDNPEGTGGGPYAAKLTIRVRNFVVADGENGTVRWTLDIEISSECVECIGVGAHLTTHHGNVAHYSYVSSDLHAPWSDCIELEYEMNETNIPGHGYLGTSQSCQSAEDAFGDCKDASLACTFDDTKTPTIFFL